MNISSLGSIISAYQTQNVNGPNSVTDRDGDNDGSGVSGARGGHGHHHGGGAFMQDVMQTLQSLGLNFPGANTTGANTNTASTTTGTNSNTQNSSVSAPDVRQALHAFLHDLRQAVQQSGASSQTGASSNGSADSDGDHDNSRPSSGGQNGYSNFGTNLQSLINSLGSNSSNSNNGADSTLQTDFSNLLTALRGNTNSGQTPPTLQDFLSKLESNLTNGGNVSSGSSTIVNTTA